MARDELRERLRSIVAKRTGEIDDAVLDDIIEEVLRATAADVAKKAMEWWRSRKADE